MRERLHSLVHLHPGLTAWKLHGMIPNSSSASVSSLLCKMAARGELRREPGIGRSGYRYYPRIVCVNLMDALRTALHQ